jgi:hypothetical protein
MRKIIEQLGPQGHAQYRSLVGGFLLAHVEVEKTLDALITWWFLDSVGERSALFQAALLTGSHVRMPFGTKVEVLAKLVKGHDEARPLLQRLRKANVLRNQVAHRRVVFLDPQEWTFRFDPPAADPMTLHELREQLNDTERLSTDLPTVVIGIGVSRLPEKMSAIQRAAQRRALEEFLAEGSEAEPTVDGKTEIRDETPS